MRRDDVLSGEQKQKALNNKYIIRIKDPLLRPGLSIETEASERYAVDVAEKLMGIARDINKREAEKQQAQQGH
jgi:hypothetical protein